MSEALSGGCHCGAIAFTVTGAAQFQFLCHCDNCRRLNGGMRLAGASFDAASLDVNGTPRQYTYRGGKAEIALNFCEHCGTPLFALPKAYPDVVVVRANAFRDHTQFQPQKNIYEGQACRWEQLLAPGDVSTS